MPAPSVITIGNFDGVHLGHRAILRHCRQLSHQHADHPPGPLRVIAVTFDRPPIAVLRPGMEPPLIDDRASHTAQLRDAGADEVVYLEATRALLGLSAEAFVEMLVERFAPRAIVEGPDFRFGKGRRGDHALLNHLGSEHGFDAVRLPRETAVLHNRQVVPVSSSLVRWLIGRGRVEDAQRCLGRPFAVSGEVVKGEQRGRTIGVPTANLAPAALEGRIIPTDGVYACEAELDDGRAFPAAVSVGTKPTFGQQQLTVEAHLVDFEGDLYGRPLTLRFARWLRDQYPFPGLESLRRQLRQDIADTADAQTTPDPVATKPL